MSKIHKNTVYSTARTWVHIIRSCLQQLNINFNFCGRGKDAVECTENNKKENVRLNKSGHLKIRLL